MSDNALDLINHLRNDLLDARKSSDRVTGDALRSVINAIDNASAVIVVDSSDITEAPRRKVSHGEIKSIIKDEIEELQQASIQLRNINPVLVEELRVKAVLLQKYL